MMDATRSVTQSYMSNRARDLTSPGSRGAGPGSGIELLVTSDREHPSLSRRGAEMVLAQLPKYLRSRSSRICHLLTVCPPSSGEGQDLGQRARGDIQDGAEQIVGKGSTSL